MGREVAEVVGEYHLLVRLVLDHVVVLLHLKLHVLGQGGATWMGLC